MILKGLSSPVPPLLRQRWRGLGSGAAAGMWHRRASTAAAAAAATATSTSTSGLSKLNLVGQTPDTLFAALAGQGMTEYWAKEITKSVHRLGATSIGDIAGMKRTMRETVEASCVIDRGVVEEHHVGEDGTQKWLINFGKGNTVVRY